MSNVNPCTGASKPLWGKATAGMSEVKGILNNTLPVNVERLIVFKFAACDPSLVFRSPSLELYSELVATADFPVCYDFGDCVFFHTIYHNRPWFCQGACGVLFCVVSCERFKEGGVEAWVRIWLCGDIQSYLRRLLMDIRYQVRTIETRHELCHSFSPLSLCSLRRFSVLSITESPISYSGSSFAIFVCVI
jgi:hypothetical protein